MKKNGNEITITEEESKKCKICNKSFDSNRKMIWHVRKIHNLSFENYIVKCFYDGKRPVCLKTGNKLSFKANKLGPWFSNFSKNNFPRKPHTSETKQKIKEGCEKNSMERFGVKNVFQSDWCKNKIKDTMINRYGVENIMQLDEMRELFSTFTRSKNSFMSTTKTSIKKYNAEHYSKTPKHKLNIRKKGFYRYYGSWKNYKEKLDEYSKSSIDCLSNMEDIDRNNPLKFRCNVCNHVWADKYKMVVKCPKCIEKFQNARSIEESNLMKWVKDNIKEKFTSNKRFNIDGKVYEADLCFENEKIVIELNGLYWHSEKAGKDRKYHVNKLKALQSLGYDVIQIFEDEWLFKTDIVKSKILHRFGYNRKLGKVYARDCEVKKITNKTSNEFLDNTHIQGKVNSSICYGAFCDDILVAVMTFSSPRINMGNKTKKDGEYELVRFSTSNNHRVIGIAGKLMKAFTREYSPSKVISYADKRWSSHRDNNLYNVLGFDMVRETQPNYWYVKKYKREYRFNFTKKKLISMGHDPNKTEWEIMKELGYDRIWDCGHLRYELNCK